MKKCTYTSIWTWIAFSKAGNAKKGKLNLQSFVAIWTRNTDKLHLNYPLIIFNIPLRFLKPAEQLVMEVGRRSDNGQIRWETNGNAVSLKKMAKSPPECVNTPVLPTDPPGNDLRRTDATATSLHQVKAEQVTTKSDIIDELLEAFQRKWMTLRSNKGRVQSTTIWRNGNKFFILSFI